MGWGRSWTYAAAALAGSTLLGLLGAEALVRSAGERPWPPAPVATPSGAPKRPSMFEREPTLGWQLRPGAYDRGPFAPTGSAIHTTIMPDRSRRTAATPPLGTHGALLTVGCSFTFGWAVSDEDTYAWKLQTRFPNVRVVNRGVGAYGTYQAMLMLERVLPELPRPTLVLYGLISHHEERNVASPTWLETLAAQSNGANTHVPYVTLDAQERLVPHPPLGFTELPGRRHAALAAFLERAPVRWLGRERAGQARRATEALLLEMHDLTARHGAELAVVVLLAAAEPKAHYVRFLREQGIRVFDCDLPLTPPRRVPGEIHPNGATHTFYAECIARELAAGDPVWLADRAAR
jgi:hypothetical protein